MAEGKWQKEGKTGSTPEAPGSYGGWVKPRRTPSNYPKTVQQRKVADAGRAVGAECRGKKGAEFRTCRHKILAEQFK